MKYILRMINELMMIKLNPKRRALRWGAGESEGLGGWSRRGVNQLKTAKIAVFGVSGIPPKLMVHPLPGGHFSDTFRQNVPAESPVNPLLSWCPLTGGWVRAGARGGVAGGWGGAVAPQCARTLLQYGMIQVVEIEVSGGAQYPTVRDKGEDDLYQRH